MSYYGADPGMPERRPPYPGQPDPRANPAPPGPPPPAQPSWDQPTAAGPGRGQPGGWQGGDDRQAPSAPGGRWGDQPRWDSPAGGRGRDPQSGGQGWDSPAAGRGWDAPAGPGRGAAPANRWDQPAGGQEWDAPATNVGRNAPADRRPSRDRAGRDLAARDNRPPVAPPPGRAAGAGYPGPKKRGRGRTTLLVLAIVVLVGGLVALGGAFVVHQKHTPQATVGQNGTPPVPSPAGSDDGSRAGAGDTFTFSAVGDTIFAFGTSVPPNNGKGFFDDVKPALAADLQFANVEEAITDDTGVRKCSAGSTSCHAFRAPPATAQSLVEAGFKIVGLANNHANDYGSAGLKNTKATLDSLGITYTGPPGLIPVLTVKGIKVAVLAFSPYAWSNDVNNIPAAVELVKEATSKADVVIVTAHVGAEGSDKTHVKPGVETYVGETRGDSYAFSHAVIDAGADLVQMQGPHVMRAMEFYKDKLIAYSMGNFAGYGGALQTTGVLGISGILHVTLGRDGSFKDAKLVPTSMVSPGYPKMDPNKRAITQVRSLTKADFPKTGAVIADDGTITPPAA